MVDVWTEQAILVRAGAQPNEALGVSAAISGNSLIMSAITAGDDFESAHTGHVYSFSLPSREPTEFPWGAGSAQDYGVSMAAAGDLLVVGQTYAYVPNSPGRVFIFRKTGETWTPEATISSPGTVDSPRFFGATVSTDGQDVLVGGQGRAFVYVQDGGKWVVQAEIGPVGGDGDSGFFGSTSVAIANGIALVGDPLGGFTTINGSQTEATGRVTSFKREGGVWSSLGWLSSPEGSSSSFGTAVAAKDGFAAIADLRRAKIYSFRLEGDSWLEAQVLTAAPASKLAFDGEHLVAANAQYGDGGALNPALIFERVGYSFQPLAELQPKDSSAAEFGDAVAVSGNYVLVTATSGNQSKGAGYVYTIDRTSIAGGEAAGTGEGTAAVDSDSACSFSPSSADQHLRSSAAGWPLAIVVLGCAIWRKVRVVGSN